MTGMNAASHEEIEARLGSFSSQVEARLHAFDMTLGTRFALIDERFEQVHRDIAGIQQRLDKMDVRLDKMDSRLDKMDSRLDKMDGRLDEMNARIEKLDAKIDKNGAELIKWMVGLIGGSALAMITIMTFVLNYASPRAQVILPAAAHSDLPAATAPR